MSKIHPDDALRTQQLWLDQRQTPHTLDVELRILAAHNDYVWLKCRGAPILNDRSEVIEWIGTIENIDEQKRRHLHVSHLAYHDSLTGLANRSQLDQHLETAWSERERGQHAALLYIDLDRFKQANDRYGHATGDDLLRHVARLTRPSDIAARIGGDEFAIVLHDIQDPSVSQLIGMRIVKALSKPYEISGQTVEIGASVGIAILTAETADIPTWMKEADSALYTAKTTGRNRSQLYAPPGPIEQSI